jgi:hypothetical protein
MGVPHLPKRYAVMRPGSKRKLYMNHSAVKNADILNDLQALRKLIGLAESILSKDQTTVHHKTLRSFAVSMVNSTVAVGTLCDAGFGADAMKIARSIFEMQVTFRYLLRYPQELQNFIDFDAVLQHKRLKVYQSEFPEVYATFSAESIQKTLGTYERVKKRFSSSAGKVRQTWSNRSLKEMARLTDLEQMYMLFYPHASSMHHVSPMGLALLIDGLTLEVRPGPSRRHVGIAIRVATSSLYETLKDYAALTGLECADTLKQIWVLLDSDVQFDGNALGSLSKALFSRSNASGS